jgi:type IV pilus assembly protein PilA
VKKIQQGFTLIELMIVVAIIGILAAVAIPAYQDYLIRSKMSEVAAALSACKTSVAEYAAARNTWPNNVTVAGCSTQSTTYVNSMAVGGDPVALTATEQNTGAQPVGCTMTLTAQGTSAAITGWSGSTSCLAKYVPATFR